MLSLDDQCVEIWKNPAMTSYSFSKGRFETVGVTSFKIGPERPFVIMFAVVMTQQNELF